MMSHKYKKNLACLFLGLFVLWQLSAIHHFYTTSHDLSTALNTIVPDTHHNAHHNTHKKHDSKGGSKHHSQCAFLNNIILVNGLTIKTVVDFKIVSETYFHFIIVHKQNTFLPRSILAVSPSNSPPNSILS